MRSRLDNICSGKDKMTAKKISYLALAQPQPEYTVHPRSDMPEADALLSSIELLS